MCPEHDVLLAGFPCQPFSIAGVSKKNALKMPHGFACEAQGTLFFRLAQIIRDHRPAAFMLENVKNLVGHDRGQTFRVIRQILEEELGYQIDWKVIDGQSWVPQHRERIFIVGFRDPTAFSFDDIAIPDRKSGPRLSSILHPEDGAEEPEKHYTVGNIGRVLGQVYPVGEALGVPPELRRQAQGGGQRVRVRSGGAGGRVPDPLGPVLQGRLRDPRPAGGGTPPRG